MTAGWAFRRLYLSESARRKALPAWLHEYNHHRLHTAIGKVTPISRLTNLPGQYRGRRAGRAAARPARPSATRARPTPARPRPSRAARSGSASRPATASATASTDRAVDDVPGHAVEHRVRRAAGAAGDDGQPGRRRLEEHDAEALDLEAGAAGAARHREDVARGVVGGQLLPRHRAGEHDVVGDAVLGGAAAAAAARPGRRRRASRAASGHPAPHRGQRPHQHVLALARHEPRHADDDRPVGQPVPPPHLARRPPPGGTASVSTPLGQLRELGAGSTGASRAAGVVAEVGHDVDVAADAAQRLAGAGQQRPADLVAVGRGDRPLQPQRAARAARAGRRRRTTRGRSPRPARCRARGAATSGVGSSSDVGCAHDGERLRGVERRGALPRRGVDDDLARPAAATARECDEGLDPAGARREVVGDDEGPHSAQAARHSRASAIRCGPLGCVANST